MAKSEKPKDIDGHISKFPADVQAILQNLRETIRHAAPEAKETISYMMPAFKQHEILVDFAAWEKHIGMYPPISDNKPWRKQSHGTLDRRAIFSFRSKSQFPTT